jgi:hypothetical protein
VIAVEQLRAQRLDWQRRLDEARRGGQPGEHAEIGADAATVAEYIDRLDQAIRTLDFMITRARVTGSGAGRAWRPEHFRPGDEALILGCWYPVVRVNRWSLTVPPLVLLGNRRLDHRGRHEWTDLVSYDAVYGRRRNGYAVRHPHLVAEDRCTELLGPPTTDSGPLTDVDADLCGQTPVARLTLHHDGTFCGCDWLCRLDRYVVTRWLEPWTGRLLLCHTHLAEHLRHDPALHQPPARVLEYLPLAGSDTPASAEQPDPPGAN